MLPRERVIKAINFDKPDRIPIMHSVSPAAFFKYGGQLVQLLKKYPQDFGSSEYAVPKLEDLDPVYRRGESVDEWGCVWQNNVDGMLGQVVKHPLSDWNQWKNYKFPDMLLNTEQIKTEKQRIKELEQEYFVLLGFTTCSNYFERLQWLRGYENLLVDLIENRPEVVELADALLKYNIESLSRVIELQPDAITFCDDWGTQQELMVSPSLWRTFFKPRYKKIFDLVHNAGIYVYFHSDGNIIDIVPDLIEIGVNILNPQFSCIDLEKLSKITCRKICVCSDIDHQRLLPYGKPSEIVEYVKKVIQLFGSRDGGLIGRSDINHYIPIENTELVYKTFYESV